VDISVDIEYPFFDSATSVASSQESADATTRAEARETRNVRVSQETIGTLQMNLPLMTFALMSPYLCSIFSSFLLKCFSPRFSLIQVIQKYPVISFLENLANLFPSFLTGLISGGYVAFSKYLHSLVPFKRHLLCFGSLILLNDAFQLGYMLEKERVSKSRKVLDHLSTLSTG
jgi:hypothetical protein